MRTGASSASLPGVNTAAVWGQKLRLGGGGEGTRLGGGPGDSHRAYGETHGPSLCYALRRQRTTAVAADMNDGYAINGKYYEEILRDE